MKVRVSYPNLVEPGNLNYDLTFWFRFDFGEYDAAPGLLNPVVLKRSFAFSKAFEG